MLIISEETRRMIKALDPQEGDVCEISLAPEKRNTFRIKLWNERNDGLAHPAKGWYFRHWPKYLPEGKLVDSAKRSWNQRDWWDVPITDTNCELISEMLDIPEFQKHIKWENDALYSYANMKVKVKTDENSAKVIGAWREKGLLPLDSINGYGEHPKFPLKDFQKVCRHNIVHNDGYAVYMKQGTGKTPTSISAMMHDIGKQRHKDPKYFYRALIICPNQVRYNWQCEFAKFGIRKGRVKIIRGSRHDREAELLLNILRRDEEEEYVAIIVGYATLARSLHAFKLDEVAGYPINAYWDYCVLDESHFIKSQKADRTKSCLEIRDKCRKRVILTGTPLTNNLLDLHSQFEFLGYGESGFSSFQAFKEFYGDYKLDEQSRRKSLVDFKNIPLLQERLAKKSFIITKEEALPYLPQKVYDIIESNMTAEQLERYKDVATRVRLEIEEEMEHLDDEDNRTRSLTIQNILVRLLRLAQVASGFCKYDDEYDESGNLIREGHTEFFDCPAIRDILDILKEKEPEQKSIVWCCFTNNIETLYNAYQDDPETPGYAVKYFGEMSDDEKEDAVIRFNNDPNCRVLFGNPASGGTGLNLVGYDTTQPETSTTNADHVIFYSQNWRANDRAQAEDRAHRNTTRVQVRISTLIIPNSIMEEIHLRVQSKLENADKLTDVKSIVSNIFNGIDAIGTNGD